jgi:hypothetical protein
MDPTGGGLSDALGGLAISKDSLERATATKELLQARMEERRREQAERRARRAALNARLADPGLSDDDRRRLGEEFDARERDALREARRRYGPGDFEPLVVIGRGAFGEVRSGRRVVGE